MQGDQAQDIPCRAGNDILYKLWIKWFLLQLKVMILQSLPKSPNQGHDPICGSCGNLCDEQIANRC